jgi:hypothetical protein
VTILVLVSPLYVPNAIHDDAACFGMIGVAFALLSRLVVLAFLLVGSAIIASEIDRRRRTDPSGGVTPGPAGGD